MRLRQLHNQAARWKGRAVLVLSLARRVSVAKNSKPRTPNSKPKNNLLDIRVFSLVFRQFVITIVVLTQITAITTVIRALPTPAALAAPARQIPLTARVIEPGTRSPIPDGTYSVRYSIYSIDRTTADPFPSDADAGSRLWTETKSITTRNGILFTFLGSTTAFPSTLDFSSNNLYLGIRIGTDPELVPRRRLGSVPHAISADSVQGKEIGTGANSVVATDASGQIQVSSTPVASATTSLIQLGSAITGGSASGTYLGLNAPAGFGGNLVDLQVNGTSMFKVDAAGNITVTSCTGCGGAGSTTLQQAYDAGASAALTTSTARDISVTLANTATDSNLLVNIAAGSTSKFAVQNGGTDLLQVSTAGGTVINTGGLNVNSTGITNAGAISGVTTLVTSSTINTATISGGTLSGGTVSGGSLSATAVNGLSVAGGTITVGVWNGTDILDADIADTLTVDASSSVAWAALTSYPSACSAGSAVSTLADVPTCTSFNTDSSITLQDAYNAGATITTVDGTPIAVTAANTTGNGLSVATSTLTSGNAVSISSTSTAAALNTQTALNVSTSGVNGTSTQTTYGLRASNSHSGTNSTNIAGDFTASGGTTNNVGVNVNLTPDTGTDSTGVRIPSIVTFLAPGTTTGINIGGISTTGGTANYGLNIGGISGATANWAIYSAGGDSALAGKLRVGSTTAPVGGLHVSTNGAASAPGVITDGSWFTGGSATTTKPQLLVEPAGTTSTAWSTSGTGLGVNAASGFAGNLVDLQVAGVSKAKIDSAGALTVTSCTGCGGVSSLQGAYNGGATITTVDGTPIAVTAANTTGNGLSVASSTVSEGNVVSLSSTSTAAANNTQKVLNVATSGANATSAQSTYGIYVSNTHTGTSSTNYGLYATATSGTTNYAGYFSGPVYATAVDTTAAFINGSSTSVFTNHALSISLTTTSPPDTTTLTGDMINGTYTGSIFVTGTGSATVAGNLLDLSRNVTAGISDTITVTGAVATLDDTTCSIISGGACNSSANVLEVKQSLTQNTGAALNVTTASTNGGLALRVNDDGTLTDSTAFVIDSVGNLIVGGTTPAAALHVATGGAASLPGIRVDGAWFSGGSATTTKPQLLVEPAGTTSTAWSTSGTGLGVNAASGFTGNLIDLQLNGSSKLTVSSAGDMTLGASQSIKLTGGAGSFPGSPTEGQIYYRTDNDQLYVYTGSQWQADRTIATKIVAASDSQNKEKADYVGDGTSDELDIASAITALPAAGGVVYLLDGTYNFGAMLTITKSNVSLIGAGKSTILKKVFDASRMIRLGDGGTTTVTGVTLSNFKIDGDKAVQTGSAYMIYLERKVSNSRVINTWIENFVNVGINMNSIDAASSNNANLFQGNYIITSSSTAGYGIAIGDYDKHNVVTGNYISGGNGSDVGVWARANSSLNTITSNVLVGAYQFSIEASGTSNTVSGNTISGGTRGIISEGPTNTITGNTVSGSGSEGIYTGSGASNNTITGNTVTGSGGYGIALFFGSNHIVSGNKIYNNGNHGIEVETSSNNISGNDITDTAGTSKAINITAGDSTNHLSGNRFSGTGATAIGDAGTGTIWASQMDGAGNIVTNGGTLQVAFNGAASAPGGLLQGTWFSGGSATTTKPYLLVEPTGTTSTAWSTSGTGIGANAASGFAGNLLDLQLVAVSKLSVSSTGFLTSAGGISVTAATTSTVPVTVIAAASQTADLIQVQNSSSANLFVIDVTGHVASSESLPGVPLVGVDPNSGADKGDLVNVDGPLKPSAGAGFTLNISAGSAYTADAVSSQTLIRRCDQAADTTLAMSATETAYVYVTASGSATTTGVDCVFAKQTTVPTFSASKPVLVIAKVVTDGAAITTIADTRPFIGGTMTYVDTAAATQPGSIVITDTATDNTVKLTTSGADVGVAGIIAVGNAAAGKAILMTSGHIWAQAVSGATRAACAGTSTTSAAVNNVTAAVNVCAGQVKTAASATNLSVLVDVHPN